MAYEHAGHRQRMYKKLETEELLDTELMEMMLYAAVPRRNTVDLVHNLLERFGSPIAVYCASLEELKSVEGIGDSIANHLYVHGMFYRRAVKMTYDPFAGAFRLGEFIVRGVDMYKMEGCEVLDVYLLGDDGRIRSRHRRTDKEEGRVRLDALWLAKLLTDENVYGVILVHNHPSGRAHHSASDDAATRACQLACNMHGKILCDHVIFSKDGAYSYYQEGRLKVITEKYTVNKLVGDKNEEEMQKAIDLRQDFMKMIKGE